MIIDTHAHYTPQAMLDAFPQRAKEFPSVELLHKDGSYALNFCGGASGRPIMPKLRDAEQRAIWLGEKGIDHQVCGRPAVVDYPPVKVRRNVYPDRYLAGLE